MTTLLELHQETKDLLRYFEVLARLPWTLASMRDAAVSALEAFGLEELALSSTDLDPETFEGGIVGGLRFVMELADLEYDGNLDDWRASLAGRTRAANEAATKANALLTELPRRDLSEPAKKHLAWLKYDIRRLEEASRSYEDPGPYLEKIRELRDAFLPTLRAGRRNRPEMRDVSNMSTNGD